jgi:hypothetical protein
MSHAQNDDIQVWVDGVLEASGRFAAHPEDSYEIRDLGRSHRFNGGDTTWIGDLDDIRIYDQVLGESEIRAVMADDSAGPTAPTDPGDFRPGVPDVTNGGGSGGGAVGGVGGGGGGGKGCGIGGGIAAVLGSLALGLGRRRRAG